MKRDLAIDEMAERAAYALLDEDRPDPTPPAERWPSGEMRLAAAVLESALEEKDFMWFHTRTMRSALGFSFAWVATLLGRGDDLERFHLECLAKAASGHRRYDKPRGMHAMRIELDRPGGHRKAAA